MSKDFSLLKRYYVLGYIYAGKGYPWKTESVEEGVKCAKMQHHEHEQER